jgi:hypothetical protein
MKALKIKDETGNWTYGIKLLGQNDEYILSKPCGNELMADETIVKINVALSSHIQIILSHKEKRCIAAENVISAIEANVPEETLKTIKEEWMALVVLDNNNIDGEAQ